jgi:hypothetical protein
LRLDPWVTDNGKASLISYEENCETFNIVITQSDMDAAVKPVMSLFTVLKAVRKFKALLSKKI